MRKKLHGCMRKNKNTIHIQKGCAIMDLDFELDDSRENGVHIIR